MLLHKLTFMSAMLLLQLPLIVVAILIRLPYQFFLFFFASSIHAFLLHRHGNDGLDLGNLRTDPDQDYVTVSPKQYFYQVPDKGARLNHPFRNFGNPETVLDVWEIPNEETRSEDRFLRPEIPIREFKTIRNLLNLAYASNGQIKHFANAEPTVEQILDSETTAAAVAAYNGDADEDEGVVAGDLGDFDDTPDKPWIYSSVNPFGTKLILARPRHTYRPRETLFRYG